MMRREPPAQPRAHRRHGRVDPRAPSFLDDPIYSATNNSFTFRSVLLRINKR